VEFAINDCCGPYVIRQAYNTMFRFLYMYSVQEATTAEALQQEKRCKGAAQHLRGAMVTAELEDEGAKQYLLSRYQDLMRKHYLSHRRPARSLELLAEDAIPDSLLRSHRQHEI
jgi:hypothetical protein